MISFWTSVDEAILAQGDYLPGCRVPVLPVDFDTANQTTAELDKADLIIVTQSCDLANLKVGFVALCPIHSIGRFEEVNPNFKKKGQWEQARRGPIEGLHLLASPADPANNRQALVVDFRQIYSLPFSYLTRHAKALGNRHRLQSPFLEHFSQAFARFLCGWDYRLRSPLMNDRLERWRCFAVGTHRWR
jgi:hypothetical protein